MTSPTLLKYALFSLCNCTRRSSPVSLIEEIEIFALNSFFFWSGLSHSVVHFTLLLLLFPPSSFSSSSSSSSSLRLSSRSCFIVSSFLCLHLLSLSALLNSHWRLGGHQTSTQYNINVLGIVLFVLPQHHHNNNQIFIHPRSPCSTQLWSNPQVCLYGNAILQADQLLQWKHSTILGTH